MNSSPLFVEVVSADGSGLQVVPAGTRCQVVKWTVEGVGGSGGRLRKTGASGNILATHLVTSIARVSAPFRPPAVLMSSDGLYVQRIGSPSRVGVWYLVG